MGVSRDRSPTEANGDVRTPEIGGISHSDWDPADEDWGRGRRMGAPERHLGGVSHMIIPVVASGLLGREWPIILMRRECTGSPNRWRRPERYRTVRLLARERCSRHYRRANAQWLDRPATRLHDSDQAS